MPVKKKKKNIDNNNLQVFEENGRIAIRNSTTDKGLPSGKMPKKTRVNSREQIEVVDPNAFDRAYKYNKKMKDTVTRKVKKK